MTAPAFWLGADPLEYARVVSGILAVLGAGVLTFVYKSLTDPVTFRLSWPLPTLLWLGHDTSAFHLMLGMETTAYTVLLMCAVAFYAGFWTRSGGEARGTVCAGLGAGVEPEARWWLRGFFGTSFLCGLMRPEGTTYIGQGVALATASPFSAGTRLDPRSCFFTSADSETSSRSSMVGITSRLLT